MKKNHNFTKNPASTCSVSPNSEVYPEPIHFSFLPCDHLGSTPHLGNFRLDLLCSPSTPSPTAFSMRRQREPRQVSDSHLWNPAALPTALRSKTHAQLLCSLRDPSCPCMAKCHPCTLQWRESASSSWRPQDIWTVTATWDTFTLFLTQLPGFHSYVISSDKPSVTIPLPTSS